MFQGGVKWLRKSEKARAELVKDMNGQMLRMVLR